MNSSKLFLTSLIAIFMLFTNTSATLAVANFDSSAVLEEDYVVNDTTSQYAIDFAYEARDQKLLDTILLYLDVEFNVIPYAYQGTSDMEYTVEKIRDLEYPQEGKTRWSYTFYSSNGINKGSTKLHFELEQPEISSKYKNKTGDEKAVSFLFQGLHFLGDGLDDYFSPMVHILQFDEWDPGSANFAFDVHDNTSGVVDMNVTNEFKLFLTIHNKSEDGTVMEEAKMNMAIPEELKIVSTEGASTMVSDDGEIKIYTNIEAGYSLETTLNMSVNTNNIKDSIVINLDNFVILDENQDTVFIFGHFEYTIYIQNKTTNTTASVYTKYVPEVSVDDEMIVMDVIVVNPTESKEDINEVEFTLSYPDKLYFFDSKSTDEYWYLKIENTVTDNGVTTTKIRCFAIGDTIHPGEELKYNLKFLPISGSFDLGDEMSITVNNVVFSFFDDNMNTTIVGSYDKDVISTFIVGEENVNALAVITTDYEEKVLLDDAAITVDMIIKNPENSEEIDMIDFEISYPNKLSFAPILLSANEFWTFTEGDINVNGNTVTKKMSYSADSGKLDANEILTGIFGFSPVSGKFESEDEFLVVIDNIVFYNESNVVGDHDAVTSTFIVEKEDTNLDTLKPRLRTNLWNFESNNTFAIQFKIDDVEENAKYLFNMGLVLPSEEDNDKIKLDMNRTTLLSSWEESDLDITSPSEFIYSIQVSNKYDDATREDSFLKLVFSYENLYDSLLTVPLTFVVKDADGNELNRHMVNTEINFMPIIRNSMDEVVGDLNGDGIVDEKDFELLKSFLYNDVKPTLFQRAEAERIADGKEVMDSYDLEALFNLIASVEDEIYISNMSTYPNPAVENVNFAFTTEQAGNIEVEIFSASGQHISSQSLGFREAGKISHNMSVNNYSNGSYFCNVIINGKRNSCQFIINK